MDQGGFDSIIYSVLTITLKDQLAEFIKEEKQNDQDENNDFGRQLSTFVMTLGGQ